MSDKSPIVSPVQPFAVRPKVGAQLAGVGLTKFYEQLNAGEYETFTEDGIRMITVRSIFERQQRLLAEANGTPKEKPSQRRAGPGRPKKTSAEITP
jgi:hypothetical protein